MVFPNRLHIFYSSLFLVKFIFFDNKSCFGNESILDSIIIAAPDTIVAVIERRHQIASQRACLAVDLLPFYEQEAKERHKRKPVDFVQEKIPE